MATTVALIYGIGEGNWHGRRFVKALRAAGYDVVPSAHAADILVAHSAGCLFLPTSETNQQLVLINPPYWPDKSPRKRIKDKLWADVKLFFTSGRPVYFFLKTIWNIYYGFRNLEHTRHVLFMAPNHNLELILGDKHTTLFRNHNDPWCTPDVQPLLQKNRALIIHELPGDHDDCWLHPEPYVNLLQSEL